MKIIYGLSRIKRYPKPVVAIGVFDGVHRGHRIILEQAVKKAKRIKGTSMVLTFWPHPQKEELLYSLRHRLRLIGETGIDVCVIINFNRKFAKLSAKDFIRILTLNIRPYSVYVGKNFRFGRNAGGNLKALVKLSKIYDFKLRAFKVTTAQNKAVSSTHIRSLIKRGRLAIAERLLCHPVSVLGTVRRGQFLARRLGFPTANIDPHHEVIPPSGVYAVRVNFRGRIFNGICNIGSRPTFEKGGQRQIEVYLFGFNKNIYGKYLEMQFLRKIREERKFASPRELIRRIKKDILTAQRILTPH